MRPPNAHCAKRSISRIEILKLAKRAAPTSRTLHETESFNFPLIIMRLWSKTVTSKAASGLALSGRFARHFHSRGQSRRSESEHQPEQREHPVPVLSRRVGHRRVHYAKRRSQRDAQPAEQLSQQLLGVLGERDVPGGRRTTWRSSSRISSPPRACRIRAFAPGTPCGDRKVLRHNHVTPVPLAELRPAMAMSSICSSTNSRKRRTSFLSILMLATERKNRSNRNTRRMGHALPPLGRTAGPMSQYVTFALKRRTRTGPAGAIRHAGSASQVIQTKRTRIQTSAPAVVPARRGRCRSRQTPAPQP